MTNDTQHELPPGCTLHQDDDSGWCEVYSANDVEIGCGDTPEDAARGAWDTVGPQLQRDHRAMEALRLDRGARGDLLRSEHGYAYAESAEWVELWHHDPADAILAEAPGEPAPTEGRPEGSG